MYVSNYQLHRQEINSHQASILCLCHIYIYIYIYIYREREIWASSCVILIVVGNGPGDMSSNPGQDFFFIIQGFRTIIVVCIVIFTTFQPICPPVFFRCFLSNFEQHPLFHPQRSLSDSVNHNTKFRVGSWVPCRRPSSTRNTWRRPDDISAETLWIYNNKDKDNSPKTLND